MKKNTAVSKLLVVVITLMLGGVLNAQFLVPTVPPELRGKIDAERKGIHDANRIRTMFYNFGMVGDYPPDPIKVDLSVFHSVEVPKGSGENYSDGITPFVLARVTTEFGSTAYIMETGFRERQTTSPISNKIMRFEPRPGYFQEDPAVNVGRSIAISNDPRTWPSKWVDKLTDTDDPGWSESWNGYFGKAALADQESYTVYDDNYYDAWEFYPDSRDRTRRGLGLRIEQRGFQWANPQAGNVVFFHYDITNEGTTDFNDNIIFGLYMDSGVGGSGIGIDGVAESDDDNAYFERSSDLNLVYTWDKFGNGARGKTGYLGYSYLETPGNPFNAKDDDEDGVIDEKRDGGAGSLVETQAGILAYAQTNYDLAKFEAFHGKIDTRPAFKIGKWFTGDEDMDWVAEFHDTGADGVFGTNDTGEGDGKPTNGEPNFDRTDVDESDQIGLTGFKMNRIKAGVGAPTTQVDQIVFFDDGKEWPKKLWEHFTSGSPFDQALVQNYNIGFLFASGPFILKAGQTERFSLALGFGSDLRELRNTTKIVQQIYKANYKFAVPPPMPTLKATAGDGYVDLTWDDASERAFDPITNNNDFEGYKIYRSTDPTFLDAQVITTGTGTGPIGNGKPIAQFDLDNDFVGFSKTSVEGVEYYLGNNTGLRHSYRDTTAVNGQLYYYAITAYDRGVDSIEIYPSENAIAVSRSARGGTILPKNVIEATPNPRAPGYVSAEGNNIVKSAGRGSGDLKLQIKNPQLVPDGHTFKLDFTGSADSVRADYYRLIDVTAKDTLFSFGNDFSGSGVGPVGKGILPVLTTVDTVTIDSINTGYIPGGITNTKMKANYAPSLPIRLKRPGFPNDIEIIFDNTIIDTSIVGGVGFPSRPTKFAVYSVNNGVKEKVKFRFRDLNNDSTLSTLTESVEVVTYTSSAPTTARATWVFQIDTTDQYLRGPIVMPGKGDVYKLALKYPLGKGDEFTFTTVGERIDPNKAKSDFEKEPYVIPNPYVAAASFEPQRYAVSGRGERRIEFRNIPLDATIRIFTVTGELVQTLRNESISMEGFVPWDLRTKDNLEVAPGLYIYHVDGGAAGTHVGKFAIIK